MEERIERSTQLFKSGYGCCQSVFAAFSDIFDITPSQAKALGAGFGAGVGRLRMMCGAVSAMVLIAGLVDGRFKGTDREGKAKCYKTVQDLLEKFKEENGSIICAELLKQKGNTPFTSPVPDERNAHYYTSRPCVAKVESAARIIALYLKENDKLK